MISRLQTSFLAIGLGALLASSAGAILPVDELSPLAVLRPGTERPPVWNAVQLDPIARPAAAEFERVAGGTWSYKWNALTGTPHSVLGSGYQAAGALRSEADAEAAARDFVARHRDLLGVDLGEVKLRRVVHALGKYSVLFEQDYQGIEVHGSRLRLVFTESGRLYYFGSDWQPGIAIATSPGLAMQDAMALARRDVGFVSGRDTDETASLVILPILEGETMVPRLAWRTRTTIQEPYAIWVSYVDARDGRTLWRYNDVHYVNVVGSTTGSVEDFGYCYGEKPVVLPHMKVNITGGNTGYSDAAGNFNINHPGNTPVTVTTQLDGRWVNVNDSLDNDATYSGTATPGVPFNFNWTDTNENDSARDVYLHANRIHDVIKQYDPSFAPPDYRMSANVNINSSCNAFWNGSSINFYRAGGGCGNTGQMGDVVYHEYGHGLTQWIYGTNPDDVGEGNSDIAALLIDGNSICGEGFYLDNCASGIRDANNTLKYPDDYQVGQIHYNGQIVSGFWWDARAILLPIHGEQGVRDLLWPIWHFSRRALEPTAMPDQIEAAFIMDDDDGDLTNGTPNYFAFCPAAQNHGFTPPGPTPVVSVVHVPLHNQVYDGSGDQVRATITSSEGAIDGGNVRLNYAVNGGGVVQVAMTPTGNPNEYGATIPALPVGSYVDYSIVAYDVVGNGGAYPPSFCTPEEPNGAVRYYVATVVDELEVNTGWTVGAPGDNATTGIWERVDPNGTGAQPENDVTPAPGVYAFVTGQCAPGCGLGDSDIDGGTTTLTSPAYDLSAATTAKVVYYRWYSNDKGATPGTDFWVVDASNNNGATWTNVENTNASSNAWVPVETDLNALFGGPTGIVKFRYVASDLNDGSLVEAAVDEFLVMVDYASDAPDGAPIAENAFHLAPARPNPFSGATELAFSIPAQASVTLKVHDVSGGLVRTLVDGALYHGGTHALLWDGRDDAGRELPAGVYYLQMTTNGFEANRKVVVRR